MYYFYLTYFQPRKLFLPKGVQIQPKFAASKDTLAVAMEAILENPIHANDDVQVVPANQVNVSQRQMVSRPVPSKPPPVVSTTAKFPVSAPNPSPVKLSEHLTISDPKPTIPSTVPDDFLDDSSFSEVTFGGENDAVTNDVSAPAATPSATATLDDSATRKSGRERKVNRSEFHVLISFQYFSISKDPNQIVVLFRWRNAMKYFV